MEENFLLYKEFYESVLRPKVQITEAASLEKAPPGVHWIKMMVCLDPVIKLWKSSVLMECEECDIQVSLCKCLILQWACQHPLSNHCKHCPQCNSILQFSHVLQLRFYDGESKSILVDFFSETMNLFLQPFQSSIVASNIKAHTDFLFTLDWHKKRADLGVPFVQELSVLKVEKDDEIKYQFVSGRLSPILDGDRLVIMKEFV